MLWGENRGKASSHSGGQTQDNSDLSCQCSVSEPWQPDNHQPSQSSACTHVVQNLFPAWDKMLCMHVLYILVYVLLALNKKFSLHISAAAQHNCSGRLFTKGERAKSSNVFWYCIFTPSHYKRLTAVHSAWSTMHMHIPSSRISTSLGHYSKPVSLARQVILLADNPDHSLGKRVPNVAYNLSHVLPGPLMVTPQQPQKRLCPLLFC